jgi:hypothetical protein
MTTSFAYLDMNNQDIKKVVIDTTNKEISNAKLLHSEGHFSGLAIQILEESIKAKANSLFQDMTQTNEVVFLNPDGSIPKQFGGTQNVDTSPKTLEWIKQQPYSIEICNLSRDLLVVSLKDSSARISATTIEPKKNKGNSIRYTTLRNHSGYDARRRGIHYYYQKLRLGRQHLGNHNRRDSGWIIIVPVRIFLGNKRPALTDRIFSLFSKPSQCQQQSKMELKFASPVYRTQDSVFLQLKTLRRAD